MLRHTFFYRFVILAFVVVLAFNCLGAEPIVVTDLLRIRSVTSIDVSKDGLRTVFAVRSVATLPADDQSNADTDAKYKNQAHLFLLDLNEAGALPRQLTTGDRNDGAPRFSPDGKRIVFVREALTKPSTGLGGMRVHDQNETTQVWMIPVDGGEARQITNFQHGCDSPQWSPDGRRILVRSSIPMSEMEGSPPWPMERPKRTWKDSKLPDGVKPKPDGTREQIRAWLDRNSSRMNPNVINRVEFQDEHELKGEMRFSQLFIIDIDPTGAATASGASSPPIEQSAARRITNTFVDHNDPMFMPDGQSIVYAAKKVTDQHIDRVLGQSLWRVNVDGVNDHVILNIDGWTLNSPKPNRDGLALAFTGQKLDEPAFRQTQLGLASLKGEMASDAVWMTEEPSFAGSIQSFDWSSSQAASIVFITAMRGGFPLMTINSGLVLPATIAGEADGRPIGVHAFGVGGGSTVYSVTSAANPCVLKVRDGRGERLAFDLNSWTANKNISLPTQSEITRPDGTKVQYWLMEPTLREANHKYPLCLEMHGGPSSMWGPGEFTMWHEFQLLCSWGYGVVYCNPRGSGGYGYEFQKKNFQDWGEGPAGDVLAAVDQAVLKDWVDPEKLVITGGSYAGYLTAWVISHDKRFKAAVAQRGVYDFSTFFGEGNAWRLLAWAMGGNPYDARFKQIIERNNPFSNVNRIKTPLLIEHGSSDLRTGVSQSEMLYRALKELNQPVEYVRYPGAGHDMSRTGEPLQRMDRLDRIIEFFERYIDNPRPAPVVSGQ